MSAGFPFEAPLYAHGPRVKTSSVPSGEKPSTESDLFDGLGIPMGLPPRTPTSATESGLWPHPHPSSSATVSPFGERMNHGVPLKSFVGFPPARPTVRSSKLSTNAMPPLAAQRTGSQHE